MGIAHVEAKPEPDLIRHSCLPVASRCLPEGSAATGAPALMNIINNRRFIFENGFDFTDRYDDSQGYFTPKSDIEPHPLSERAVIRTNLDSMFTCTRPLIDGMRSRGFGRIILISSINGQKGQMGQTNYSAAKAGEIGFTKALAQEGARAGITVNAIAPGYINTEMVQAVPKDVLEKNILPQIPIGRLGEPEEIARIVVFLASDDAGLITGSTISANGGQYFA